MAAVKDCKDTLCLFDVDGTVTPARLVSLILRIVLFGGERVHGDIVCEVVLCKKVSANNSNDYCRLLLQK